MNCRNCMNELFKIEIRIDCSDCVENGAYFEGFGFRVDGYTYDSDFIKEKGLTRDQVENDCECTYGTAHGEGCCIFKCSECKATTHLFMLSE